MAQMVWKMTITEETSDEDLERCLIAVQTTSDPNVQIVAAKAQVEKDRRQSESDLANANERIAELETLNTQLQTEAANSGRNPAWMRWGIISGWVTAGVAVIALIVK